MELPPFSLCRPAFHSCMKTFLSWMLYLQNRTHSFSLSTFPTATSSQSPRHKLLAHSPLFTLLSLAPNCQYSRRLICCAAPRSSSSFHCRSPCLAWASKPNSFFFLTSLSLPLSSWCSCTQLLTQSSLKQALPDFIDSHMQGFAHVFHLKLGFKMQTNGMVSFNWQHISLLLASVTPELPALMLLYSVAYCVIYKLQKQQHGFSVRYTKA